MSPDFFVDLIVDDMTPKQVYYIIPAEVAKLGKHLCKLKYPL